MVRPAFIAAASLLSCGVASGQAGSPAQLHAERGMQLMQAGELPAAELELRQAVKLSPQDPTYLGELGVALGGEGKLAESDRYFQEALRIDPDDANLRRNLAKNQWRLREFEGAAENLRKVLKAQPSDGESALILGMVEMNLKHYAAAVRLLISVPALVKQHPEAVVALAQSYYQVKNPAEARRTLRGLRQDRASPEALYLGGQSALQAEDYKTAADLFTAAQTGYPDRAKAGYFLALSLYRGENFQDCQQTIQDTLAAASATRELYALLGWCYAKQDNIKAAAQAFNQAVELDPKNETTYEDLGTVFLDHHQDGLALALGKEMAVRFPNSYRASMLQGTAQANLGYLTDAIQSFKHAVELNPASPQADYDLAIIQSLAGFTDDSLATLERGMRKFPRDAPHYEEFASLEIPRAEANVAGAKSQAYEALYKALALDKNLARAHLLLGRLELNDHQAVQAVGELETAARLDPTNTEARLLLSRAYTRLGKQVMASEELAKYKKSSEAELKEGRGRTPATLRRW
jgi:Flp pilus assembly protein TadD